MSGPDPKAPPRIRDRSALAAARLRFRACAACGRTAGGIHHIVQRGSPHFGDDVIENLLGLCGSGTTGCHGAVHGSPYVIEVEWAGEGIVERRVVERRTTRWVAERIGEHLVRERPDAIAYVLERVGAGPGGEAAAWDWLRRTYHVDLT